jgi:hypothetical protein
VNGCSTNVLDRESKVALSRASFTTVLGLMICTTGKAHKLCQMATATLVHSWMGDGTDSVFSFQRKETIMKGISNGTIGQESEKKFMKTEESTGASGCRASITVWASSSKKVAPLRTVDLTWTLIRVSKEPKYN